MLISALPPEVARKHDWQLRAYFAAKCQQKLSSEEHAILKRILDQIEISLRHLPDLTNLRRISWQQAEAMSMKPNLR
jgi:hypothetical protein